MVFGASEPGYTPRYEGGPRERDAPITSARSFLEPISMHLHQACIGQVNKIFDAQAPHLPRGCFAQAWSVAEILRAWLALSGKP